MTQISTNLTTESTFSQKLLKFFCSLFVFYQTTYEEQVFLFKILFTPFPFASLVISVKQIPSQPQHLLVHFFAATFIKTLTEDSNFVKLQADSESAFNGTQTTMASFQNIFAFICITLLARYLSHRIYNYTRRLITKMHG